MARNIRDVMMVDPISLPPSATIETAATAMREGDIGNVIVADDGQVLGIVTDRDIVVRAVADGLSPGEVTLGEICSSDLVVVRPGDTIDEAAQLMREHALRRLPVVDETGAAVGIVSVGDLAVVADPASALGTISAAPPNT